MDNTLADTEDEMLIVGRRWCKEGRRNHVPRSCEGIRTRLSCGVDLRILPRSLSALSEVEKAERKELLVGGDCIRVGGRERFGRVYGILLRGARETEDDDSERASWWRSISSMSSG